MYKQTLDPACTQHLTALQGVSIQRASMRRTRRLCELAKIRYGPEWDCALKPRCSNKCPSAAISSSVPSSSTFLGNSRGNAPTERFCNFSSRLSTKCCVVEPLWLNSPVRHGVLSYFSTVTPLSRTDAPQAESRSGAAEVTSRGWQITDENESDWHSHAAAIARSVELIKARMQWKEVLSRLGQLDAEMARPDVWEDVARAGKCSRERGALAARVKAVDDIENELLENVGLAELAHEEHDVQVEADVTRALAQLRKAAKERELAALLSGQHDSCPCFLEVQAGAGGVESMDWAAMVMRMYRMWALHRGFQVTLVDEMPGEEAGIKRATIRVDGEYAYGYAKTEAGVHRLVRISPFDAGKRRHTSFAAVAVMPVLDDAEVSVEISEADLRIERYRAGGAGGQHVNKTESAVRIVHLPTGITVQCQSDRSQHRNKQTALGVLQSRLYQMEVARRAQANAQHTQALGDISWGNQIRSYVLQPYQMVKDLRTNYEVSDPESVLDGDLDGFILTFLANSSVS